MSIWQLAFLSTVVLVVAEGIAILALARALGLLQVRLGPEPGALNIGEGLPLYAEAPPVTGLDLNLKKPRVLGFEKGRFGLIFADAGCGACRDVVRDTERINASGSGVRLVIVATGSHEQNGVLHQLAPRVMLLSDPAGDAQRSYKVQTTPFAFLIEDGRIQAKGIVNHRDHLESLFESVTSDRSAMAWVPASHRLDAGAVPSTPGAFNSEVD